MTHADDCDCDECALPRARKPWARKPTAATPTTKLGRFTLRLAMIWAAFRMVADLATRTASALATPAALAILAWIIWEAK